MNAQIKKQFIEEAKIRGLILNMSADMEQTLLRIMLYSIVDDPTPVIRNFKRMTMGKKINFAENDLKKYHSKIYAILKDDFKELRRINNLRGQLAHCKIIWDDNDDTILDILDIEMIKGEWHMTTKRYTKIYIAKEVEIFRKLLLKTAAACQTIIDGFMAKYPHLVKPLPLSP